MKTFKLTAAQVSEKYFGEDVDIEIMKDEQSKIEKSISKMNKIISYLNKQTNKQINKLIMQTKINNTAPAFFAVYHRKNGTTFKKAQDEISIDDFDALGHEDVRRIELYKNGTENLAPEQVDRLDRNI